MTFQEKLEELQRRWSAAEAGGGEERRARQHAEGKLSARERLDVLFDPGSFEEIDMLVEHRCHDFGMSKQRIPGDAVVNGSAWSSICRCRPCRRLRLSSWDPHKSWFLVGRRHVASVPRVWMVVSLASVVPKSRIIPQLMGKPAKHGVLQDREQWTVAWNWETAVTAVRSGTPTATEHAT